MAERLGTDKGTLQRQEKAAELLGQDRDKSVQLKWAAGYAWVLGITIDQLQRLPDEQPTTTELVAAAPPEIQEHIRALVAHLNRSS